MEDHPSPRPGATATPTVPAESPAPPEIIVLPGATSAEGITKGAGRTFYAGDIFRGHVYRGDLTQGTAEVFVEAPAGRYALGLHADLDRGWLLVAGGYGAAHVYDLATGATVATYDIGDVSATLVNDVTMTSQGAFFTDSSQPCLYFVPVSSADELGPVRTIPLTGPAAEITGEFNVNGIVPTPDETALIVSHTAKGKLYLVDPATGASRTIAGVDVPGADGLVLDGTRLWAVQNFPNRVARIQLDPDFSSGHVEHVITHQAFQVPATAFRFDDRLAVVNAKFDTGVPPTADRFEVVIVPE